LGINNGGQTVGYYLNATGEHGFFYDGSTWTTLDDPNASALFGGTVAFGLNNSGQIVGSYYDATNTEYAFVFDGGTYTTLGSNLAAIGIDDSDQIVGFYTPLTASVPEPNPYWISGISLVLGGLARRMCSRHR
jgi:probable HAF family extracellular repeat protein